MLETNSIFFVNYYKIQLVRKNGLYSLHDIKYEILSACFYKDITYIFVVLITFQHKQFIHVASRAMKQVPIFFGSRATKQMLKTKFIHVLHT